MDAVVHQHGVDGTNLTRTECIHRKRGKPIILVLLMVVLDEI